jgi:hypothetical protein
MNDGIDYYLYRWLWGWDEDEDDDEECDLAWELLDIAICFFHLSACKNSVICCPPESDKRMFQFEYQLL